jgi:hypothetical protein
MNALIGAVKILPVNEYAIWYSPAEFPTVSTDAVLIDWDGDLLLVNPGWGFKVINVQQVNRIVTHRVAIGEEIAAEERQQFDEYWQDR